jgi:hypothetical protein
MPLVEGFRVHPWHELGGTFGASSICSIEIEIK